MKVWCVLNTLIAVVFTLAFLSSPALCFATTTSKTGLELYPAFSEVVLDQLEQEKTIEITLINHYAIPISVKVFPIDFKQAGDRGQIDFIGQDPRSYSYSLTSFLAFENNLYTIEPQQSEVVRVTAKNRDDLSPGGHYAAVVVQLENMTTESEGTKITHALSSLILLRKVGGELFNLSLVDVLWPHSIISFSQPKKIELLFQNEGNIHMTPYGTVEIFDMFNRLLSKGVINVSSERVFPESQRYIQVTLENQGFAFPISLNRLKIRGNDSLQKAKFVYNTLFLSINLWTLIPLLGIAVFAYVGFIRLRKKQ